MKAYSERVPGKNMRQLCGRPLFHWIMDSLNNSGVIDEIIINTDSEEIANDAKNNFDVTIHMRPKYLLKIQSNEAYQIMAYDLKHTDGEYFLQTHSTTPLIHPETIRNAVSYYFKNLQTYDSLLSVTPLRKRLYDKKGVGLNHNPKKLIKTQNLPLIFEENSCIYIFSRKSFIESKNRIGTNPLFFQVNRFEAVDIDEEFDFIIAETLMKKKHKF